MAVLSFDRVSEHAAERYRPTGRVPYHFARGKLRGDPVCRAVFESGLIPREGAVLDLGCGGGLMLALLASKRILTANATSPAWRLIGVETRQNAAAIARQALGSEAEIVTDDVRRRPLPPARAILLFDVLNMMRAPDQDALLAAVLRALEPGGILLIREADADAGWRFNVVKFGNRMKVWSALGSTRDFHFRSLTEWRGWLERAGLEVEARPMSMGTPFGNVLLIGRRTAEPGG